MYVALGVDLEGHKEVLGLWTSGNEGAKFWLSVLTELRNRGVKDMLIVCVAGLKGFPQAIETVFPLAQVQAVHRAPGTSQPQLRELEGTEAGSRRPETDLSRGDGGGSGDEPGKLHGALG